MNEEDRIQDCLKELLNKIEVTVEKAERICEYLDALEKESEKETVL